MNEILWIVDRFAWQLPARLLLRQFVHFRRMWRAVKGNARVLVAFNIFWTLPNSFMGIYLPLFMARQGLTKIEIGTIVSAQVGVQMLGALSGGYLADRLGRLRTVFWVDLICWPAAYLFFTFATGYLGFLAGALCVGGIFALMPAWASAYLQDSPPERRAHMYGILQIPWFAGGVAASLSAPLVAKYGVTMTCRAAFATGAVLSLVGLWWRSRNIRWNDPPAQGLKPDIAEVKRLATGHWLAFLALVRRRQLLVIFMILVLFQMAMVTGGTYNNLYIVDEHGVSLPPSVLALLPLVSGVAVLLTTFLLVPFMTMRGAFRWLATGLVMMAANVSLMLLAPPGAVKVIMAGAVLGGIGFALYNPSVTGYWSTLMRDRERPRILAFATVASMAVTMPIPTIAGALYTIHPRGPVVMLLWIYAIMGACVIWAAARSKRHTRWSADGVGGSAQRNRLSAVPARPREHGTGRHST